MTWANWIPKTQKTSSARQVRYQVQPVLHQQLSYPPNHHPLLQPRQSQHRKELQVRRRCSRRRKRWPPCHRSQAWSPLLSSKVVSF